VDLDEGLDGVDLDGDLDEALEGVVVRNLPDSSEAEDHADHHEEVREEDHIPRSLDLGHVLEGVP
jgi:hypothetical protein